MKSKSFDLTRSPTGPQKMNKTFDFVGLYKTAAENDVKFAEKRKSDETSKKEFPKIKAGSSSRERSPNKNKKRHKQEQLDVSQINIDGSSLNASCGRSSPSRTTSTPVVKAKTQSQLNRVKSIMKNTSHSTENDVEDSEVVIPISTRSKKRNKSVSFMLDENEEVVIKKTKSENTSKTEKSAKNIVKDKKKVVKKLKVQQSEKENTASSVNNQDIMVEDKQNAPQEQELQKIHKSKKKLKRSTTELNTNTENAGQDKKKKLKKVRNQNHEQSTEPREIESNNNEVVDKKKKPKKKKHQIKVKDGTDVDEPASKSSKIESKPDITEDLENLSIGDNAHTLTNLLDEMTVVDKANNKKLKQKLRKNKKLKVGNSSPEPGETDTTEVKEKVKWKRRKWNRDKKGDVSNYAVDTNVIVENLPLSIMLNYKKLLSEHFGQYGLIRKIGVAEVYPTEESKPVFTTTIRFSSDEAVERALEEDNVQFQGSRIRVKRPLPATETTLVVRSYAHLTDQSISSAFLGAGKIRSIQHLVKGKKTIGTAFVEFDGPESVERAIKMAAKTKIGGKKIHVSKFEIRNRKETEKADNDSAAEADSEDSID